MSQTSSPGARLRTGAHGFWRQHCRLLLTEAGAGDPDLRAEVLLAALSAELLRHLSAGGATAAELSRRLAAVAADLAR